MRSRLISGTVNVETSLVKPTMKLALQSAVVVAMLGLFLFAAPSANASACVSSATGNWSATSTWTGCGGTGIPVAADTVEIRGGFTVTVDVSNAVATSIQVGGNPGAGTGTLVFNSGSQLTVSGSVTLGSSITAGNNGTLTMTSGGTLSAGSLALGSLSAKTWTPGTGTVVLTTTNTIPATIFTTFNSLTITAGTTLAANLSTSVNGTLTQTANIAVGSFTLTVNGAHIAGTNAVTGAGGYTLASGATLYSAHTNGVTGNIATITHTFNVGANYTFNGTAAQVTSTMIPATVNKLQISNAAGVTLSQNTTITSTLSVTAGTFTMEFYSLSVGGATSVSARSLSTARSSRRAASIAASRP